MLARLDKLLQVLKSFGDNPESEPVRGPLGTYQAEFAFKAASGPASRSVGAT